MFIGAEQGCGVHRCLAAVRHNLPSSFSPESMTNIRLKGFQSRNEFDQYIAELEEDFDVDIEESEEPDELEAARKRSCGCAGK